MPTNFLSRHFADTRRRITPEEVERQRFIFGSTPFHRWMLLPAAALIQMTVGSFYAWSVYNAPITHIMNEGYDYERVTKEMIAETFYCAVAFFGVAACLSGPWLERHGPRRMSLIGAFLFFIGHMISALGCHLQLVPLLYVGYGFFGGLAIGMSYLVPVAVLQQWYPDKKGFSAGVSVGSFGLGSVIASFSQAALLQLLGPKLTFVTLGCIYFVLHAVFSFVLRFPPPDFANQFPQPLKANSHAAVGHTPAPDNQNRNDKKPPAPQSAPQQTLATAHTGEGMSSSGTAVHGHDDPQHHSNDDHHGSNTALHAGSAGATHNARDELVADPLSHLHDNSGAHPHVAPDSVPLHKDDFIEELKSTEFIFIYVFFFLSVIPGLVIVSRVADMVTSAFRQTTSTAVWITGVNGLCNVLGRFLAGILSDKLPRLALIIGCMVITICVMVTMYVSLSVDIFPLFIFSMWTLTCCYGAACALIPGILGDVFGSGHIGALYGVSLTSWAAGGVIGGVGFTAIINQQRVSGVAANHVYDVCLYSMIPLAALGIIVCATFAIRRRQAKRHVKHPLPNANGATNDAGAIEMQRTHTGKSISSITGGRYAVDHHHVVRHPPVHP